MKLVVITDQRDTVEGFDPQDCVFNLYRKYHGLDKTSVVELGKVIDWVADVSDRANKTAEARGAQIIYHLQPPIAWLTDLLGAGLLHSLTYQTTTEASMKPSRGVWV